MKTKTKRICHFTPTPHIQASCNVVLCVQKMLHHHPPHVKMPIEPDLSMLVDMATDRLCIRNIIYTAWSVFNSGKNDMYSRWEVKKTVDGRGYLLIFHFCKGYRIALSDMLTLQDASPLRIDSMSVKEPEEEDKNSAASLLCLCILNSDQPVQLTETDVVRIRKRSRGLLGTARDLFAARKK